MSCALKATNKDVIVFNPAIPNYKLYGLGLKKYTATAKSYVVMGEVLSSAYLAAEIVGVCALSSVFAEPLGDSVGVLSRIIFHSKPFWETNWLENENWTALEAHDINNVISAMGGNNAIDES